MIFADLCLISVTLTQCTYRLFCFYINQQQYYCFIARTIYFILRHNVTRRPAIANKSRGRRHVDSRLDKQFSQLFEIYRVAQKWHSLCWTP